MTKSVLVVGAGPVGLTMAAELARYRVPVRIIDQAPAPTDKSKALGVWSRTLELLDRAGCAEAFVSAGLKSSAATIRSGRERIAHISFDSVPSPFQFLLMLPQSETERLLGERVRSLGITVERRVELTGFDDLGQGVSCAIRHADGREETIEASWLIGCDGAHSLVRHKLGMAFEGDTLATNFILADVHVAGFDEAPDELVVVWHEDGSLVFFPISAGRYRVVADVGGEPRQEPTLEEVQAIVAGRGLPGVVLSDPVWLAAFGVNERKVENYRAGRVFLAGDAAHVHSPAGGQGMNTGMQDAFNLAWKLALVEQGLASPDLLDSYSAERSAVARGILEESGRMTRVATIRSHLLQDIRNFAAHRILGFTDVQHAIADQLSETTIGYPNSPINKGSARGVNGPAPGRRIIAEKPFGAGDQPRLALMAGDSERARDFIQRHSTLMEAKLRAPPDPAGVWLVRPDGYVAAAAHAGDWAPIEDCLARLASGSPARSRPAA
jgi:2-polyprenyl-6-methoxyphenol hydroxylase-like FAD-dependent oxidoreductase